MSKLIKQVRGIPTYNEQQAAYLGSLLNTINQHYAIAGFMPYSPPPLEAREVILAKGGIGNQVFAVNRIQYDEEDGGTRYCLPFDRTVPFAAFIARNERDICYPVKRYDIGYSFRGERAQSGRFNCFIQADIDVIGDRDLDNHNDIECFSLIYHTLTSLGVGGFKMHLNDIRVIRAILAHYEVDLEQQNVVLRLIDKLAKHQKEVVYQDMVELEILPAESCLSLIEIFSFSGSIEDFKNNFQDLSQIIMTELQALNEIFIGMKGLGAYSQQLIFSPMIARGLDYYSGPVFETFLDSMPELGSIASGGRYDDLASHFTKTKHPGVGGSIGVTRLFSYLIAHKLIPDTCSQSHVLIGFKEQSLALTAARLAQKTRNAGFTTDLYAGSGTVKKQFGYAHKKGVDLVVIVISEDLCIVKNLAVGSQFEIGIYNIVACLQNHFNGANTYE